MGTYQNYCVKSIHDAILASKKGFVVFVLTTVVSFRMMNSKLEASILIRLAGYFTSYQEIGSDRPMLALSR